MKTNEKSQTIKIDIRSLGYGRVPGKARDEAGSKKDYFDALDYRFLFEHAYDAILLADSGGRILDANSRATRFFGYVEEGLAGMPLQSLVAGVNEKLLADIREVITEGRYMRIQAFAVRKDETFTAVEIVAMSNSPKGREPVCYLIRDIQTRWQAEQKLLSAYHAMDNTDSGIGIVNMNGAVLYSNRMMTRLLAGGDEQEVVGQILDTWFDRKTVIAPMFEKIGQGEAWSGEQRVLNQGEEGWLMISAVPDINEEEELCGMVISIRDTAERRRAEMAEKQAERTKALMDNMAAASHALGQPATVLLSSLEILKLDNGADENMRREMIDLCYGAVIQLREQLNRMNVADKGLENGTKAGD
ncbi:MAG: PAS domain S-box protein [Kiritimatiellae bacterium]|nr:PAS domain S-box protein [Kiritimatiellia bacterium]MDD4025966.1 PAS domain S-box protein [Kiritimatiellia bacterium]